MDTGRPGICMRSMPDSIHLHESTSKLYFNFCQLIYKLISYLRLLVLFSIIVEHVAIYFVLNARNIHFRCHNRLLYQCSFAANELINFLVYRYGYSGAQRVCFTCYENLSSGVANTSGNVCYQIC